MEGPGFTLTKGSLYFQPLKSVALFLRECVELIQPTAIFSFERRVISFLMNLQSTVVGSQLPDTFSAVSFRFFLLQPLVILMHLYLLRSKDRGQAARLQFAVAVLPFRVVVTIRHCLTLFVFG